MENMRLWAQFRYTLLILSLCVGITAAIPAGAQNQPTLIELTHPVKVDGIACRYLLDGPLPSSSSTANFSPWSRMHPHTFDGKLSSYVEQCKSTVGKLPWLTSKVCEEFGSALEQGNCAVVPDANNINIDVVRGKRNGHSMAFLNEHMQLKESRQAIFVSLPDHLWLGVFAGEPGQSCNNFFALRDEPPLPLVVKVEPPPAPVVIATPPLPPAEVKCRFVKREKIQIPSTFVHVNDFNSCGCYIPGVTVSVPGGIQSSSSYVCE